MIITLLSPFVAKITKEPKTAEEILENAYNEFQSNYYEIEGLEEVIQNPKSDIEERKDALDMLKACIIFENTLIESIQELEQ